MNWEEACRDSISVKTLVLRQKMLTARGETLVGATVKVVGFLVFVETSRPEDAHSGDMKRRDIPALLVEEGDNHHLMHNLLRRNKYVPEYVIPLENDRYLFMRLDATLPSETFLEETNLWAAVPAVVTGLVVASARPDVPFAVQPISTTVRRPYDKEREFTVTV